MSFVHLHLHTQFSLLDGANKIGQLLPHVAKLGMPAVAMTDHGNMHGTVEFWKAAEAAGVQPIVGCEVYVAPRSRFDKASARSDDPEAGGNYHLVLLAQNEVGYRNLCKLVSSGYIEGFYYKPRIDKELLKAHHEGLFCLSGCLASEVNQNILRGDLARAREVASEFAQIFSGDRYFIEIQDNHLEEQVAANRELTALAKHLGLPLVATNDCHYLERQDHSAHEVLLCIQTGKTMSDPKRWKFGTDQLFVKSPEEMRAAFAEFPQAIDNTVDLAKRCDFKMSFGQYQFPDFAVPEGETLDDVLQHDAETGLESRLEVVKVARKLRGDAWDALVQTYRERLRIELDVIRGMGFAGYFLIVADFINWAKSHGIPVGPGRGSAAGSLVAYVLRITDLDPIPHGLLFERFLNPERKSMPDIDVDFCIERRDEVLQYVKTKYGADRVAQIATFGTMKGKAALKDVGRALDFNYTDTDRLAKLYPAPRQGKDFKLLEALEMEPRLREARDQGDREKQLFEYAVKLEGLPRHTSTHAAGVVISSRPLVESCPLFVEGGRILTQFSGVDIEKIGLIKFDFLGLKNLTVIQSTLERIQQGRDQTIDLERISLEDRKTYRLFCKGDTTGVFQMESSGMRKLLTDLKPSCFEDIVAVNALFRPGPLDSGMVEAFIRRKHGREPITYLHPKLERILADTYGVIVYQEQVMQVAQVLAGYSLGDADNLRRAMGKKKKEEMERERSRFVGGCTSNGLDGKLAGEIFDQMETFAAYGFNKSHAAAYALLSFQTAYLKAHFPEEFIAALLTLDMSDPDKTHKNIAEARSCKIAVLPPDVNESRHAFTVVAEKIRFGLGGVRDVGGGAVEAILQERDQNGPFRGLDDFVRRIRSPSVNRKVLESLVKCGAFDFAGVDRAVLLAGLEDLQKWAARSAEDLDQHRLFGGGPDGEPERFVFPKVTSWTAKEKLSAEKKILGFFVSGHPLDGFERHLSRVGVVPTPALRALPSQQKVVTAGVVQRLQLKNNKKGNRYATFALEDREGTVEVIAWPEAFRKFEALLTSEEPICVNGKLEVSEERCTIVVDDVQPVQEARARAIRELQLVIHAGRGLARQLERDDFARLRRVLEAHPGSCPSYLHVVREGWEARIELSGLHVSTSHAVLTALNEGVAGVEPRFVT